MVKKEKIFALLLLFFVILLPFTAQAEVSQQVADSIAGVLNTAEDCSTCSYYASEHSAAGMINTIVIAVLVLLGSIWLYSGQKKFYILLLGIFISGAVAASYFAAPYFFSQQENVPANCPVIDTKGSENTFTAPGNEFQSVSSPKAEKDTLAAVPVVSDEFTNASSDEFKNGSTDEFSNASKDEFKSGSNDEFSSAGNEFATTDTKAGIPPPEDVRKINYTMIYEPLAIFIILALIGFLIKYEWFRKTRSFFLIASVIYLGFYRGACPCMISSFQNGVLMIFGVPSVISTVLTAIIMGLYNKFKNNKNKEEEDSKLIKQSIQALLRNELLQNGVRFIKLGWVDPANKQNYDNMYSNYHLLGKNGVMDELHDEVMNLPMQEPTKPSKKKASV